MLPSQVFVSTCKRKRGPNWSEKEKDVLVEEYRRRRHVLRPKGPGLSTVSEREKAWEEICGALKAVSGPCIKRDVVDVRKKWDNLCFWAKKCIAEWKDRNTLDGGLKSALASDNAPPTLALKILAIYQEEWAELFPNAQVVDGGDVFFVFNTGTTKPDLPKDKKVGQVLKDDGGGEEDRCYEVVHASEADQVKSERAAAIAIDDDDPDSRWKLASDDESSYPDFSDEPQPQQDQLPPPHPLPPQGSHTRQHNLPHHFIQRTISHRLASPSPPPPLDCVTQVRPSAAAASSNTSTTLSHTTLSSTAGHPATTTRSSSHFHPFQLHSTIPPSMVSHHHPFPNACNSTPLNTAPPPQAASSTSSPYKRMRYSDLAAEDSLLSDLDDEKDIEQLSRELLILRKEKLMMEKQKLEIEKEKLVIERDILDMQRERQWLQLEKDRAANGQSN